ncbi:2-isopropylmalate synthase [Granulicella pectinivorans]|jgi:2-isopropylmalate synthase|uniref:2-isopropylmalate synthase n=1 Tax=Granulicella pectinivorans TaxID=474950 RepID=A0A1I6MTG3_9BACT|nr:2-isopropylmalate synthase [Granulicella pectinivorans]SFS18828.1 2-isopropylmalate synthase [Granulicella pectinivorans]
MVETDVKHTDGIVFFDTTLRDGEQSPGCTMHADEKLRLAHQLAALGVDVLEAGFAIASTGDSESIRAIARDVKGPRITSLARCKREDIEAAAYAIEPAAKNRIHVFLASSDLHLEAKLKITRAQALEQAAESVRLACTYSDDVEFSAEDATRTDPDFLTQIVTVAVQAGAKTINLPDTVGYTTPAEYTRLFQRIKATVPGIENIILSTHCHNDLGMAVANSLAGIEGGARQVECTINGIGERAGNAALEEIAAALMVRRDVMPYTNNIVMTQLYPTSKMLAETISFGCSPNKAVVGANAFAHESGIHQHGMMANPLTYEIMTPASVGVAATNMVLGKHSGRRALADRLSALGHVLDREELDAVYGRFTALADRKKSIYDQDLLGLLKAESPVLAPVLDM